MRKKLALILFFLIFPAASAFALEASFGAGTVTQVEGENSLLKDTGFKFLAILNFPLRNNEWEMAPIIDFTKLEGNAGSGVNSITSVGFDVGLEWHPDRGRVLSPIAGIFAGPTLFFRDAAGKTSQLFAANAGVYLGGALKTGSLTFYAKGLYDYTQAFGAEAPSSFSMLSFVGGVEIFIDTPFQL